MAQKLETYRRKRRFDESLEPSGTPRRRGGTARVKGNGNPNGHALSFVIQEHDARRLHYDFRLELDGTLKSWAVPKGPSLDPSVKRLAVHVEDHPLEYGSFEGEIPEGNYGAGTVLVWDRGTWEPAGGEREAHDAYEAGKLKFRLDGEKLHGGWMLVKSHMRGSGAKEQWLLIKERDDEARSEDKFDVLAERPGSVLSHGDNKKAGKTAKPRKGAPKRKRGVGETHTKAATRSAASPRTLATSQSIKGAVKAGLRRNSTKPTKHAKKVSALDTSFVAGVRISHPERVIDESTGATKLDLVRYYEWIAPRMLPHLAERPVALVRGPDGIGGEHFFQKHGNKLALPHVTQHKGLDPGHAPLLTIDSIDALVSAAQMDAIEFHTWNGVASALGKPDRMVFDLDPDPALEWDAMIEAAQLTRELLAELGLESWCKTSGGKGLHVVVPITKALGWEDVKAFSQAIAQHMAGSLPERFSAKMGKQNRKKKIFVDYLRNNRGSSTIAAFSARARAGLGVSVPLAWHEVEHTTSGDQWTIGNLHERLDALKSDPWAGYSKCRQRITAAMRKRLDRSGKDD
jgi:DNA ligase D-like protein (predicted polymerase)/DNA ligase D-like protein (predicted 3'-phosphoesterase)